MPRKYIEGDVDVSKLMLTELPDFLADVAVRGSFDCRDNHLTSLKGSPLSVTENYFCDNNKKSFHEWFLKHLNYAKKEAADLYLQNKLSPEISFWGSQADRKSWIRYKIWNKLPILIRPFIYFIYRYFFRF